MGKDAVPDTVKHLVETFDRNLDSYHSSAYNETQLRRDFLDPFFETLGWDEANKKGYDQRYREVGGGRPPLMSVSLIYRK